MPYDGRFTFVRIQIRDRAGRFWAGGRPSWVHGYPVAEENLMRIMNDISYLGPHTDEVNVLTLDDPELFKYPIAYIIEVGWWTLTDQRSRRAARLHPEGRLRHRRRLQDARLARQRYRRMGAVRSEHEARAAWRAVSRHGPVASDLSFVLRNQHDLDNFPQAYNSGRPFFRGVFEDNDPSKRLVMIVNYNTDISQYWEWSGRGLRPVDDTNEAYKLGVNYLMYGMTH